MSFLKRKIYEFLLKQYQKEVSDIEFKPLTDEQRLAMLSQMWESQAFRNYIVKRETELVLHMTNRFMKPTSDDYLINFGRRLELMNLHDHARSSFSILQSMRKEKQDTLAKVQRKNSVSLQA